MGELKDFEQREEINGEIREDGCDYAILPVKDR